MEWVETTGRTIEEAKEAALDRLGVAEDDAEFEVLEEARSGLFGRLRGEARVRARVRPTAPRPKDDRGRRRGRPSRGGGPGGGGRAAAGDAGGGAPGDEDRGARRAPSTKGSEAAPRGARASAPRGGQSRPRAERPPRRDGDERQDAGQSGGNDMTMTEEPSLDEQGQVAEEFVAGLVDALGIPGTSVERRQLDDETVEVRIEGEPSRLGMLIGPRARTLSAIQELARTVVQRQTGARQGKIMVDVAGYRERRRAALEAFTRRVAETVRETGVAQALEPMSPSDRKVVHDTVNDIDGVSTISEGEHADRRVVIVPGGGPAAG